MAQSALGDLIISVGDVRSKGFTLRGLEEARVETDWLSITVREFWRSYVETADKTRERALRGFINLLRNKVFPDNQWKVVEEIPERLTQNAGLVLEGAFTSSRQQFPERGVHIRLLWEDEGVKDANNQGEVLIQIRLRRYLDKKEEERRFYAEPLHIDFANKVITITLNMMGRSVEISPLLERAIGPIVSPYKLTPLLLLNLYQVMEEHRERDAIPKNDDQQIRHMFQPDLLDSAFRELFNETVGSRITAAQERLVELALKELLAAMYPSYQPLVSVSNWMISLQKYRNALGRLDSNYERQGQIEVEGNKDQIAALFPLSNTGLDSFARNFPDLINTQKLSGRGTGSVRFTLHPLELTIKKWLQESEKKVPASASGKSERVHSLSQAELYDRAHNLGYLDKEVEAIVELMEARGLVERDLKRGELREAVTLAPSVDELESLIKEYLADIQKLQGEFTNDSQLRDWETIAVKAADHLNTVLRKQPNDTQLYQRKRGMQQLRRLLELYVENKHTQLREEATTLLQRLPRLEPQVKHRLDTSIQGAVEYSYQVNSQLRSGLQRQYTKLESDIGQWQQHTEGVRTALQAAPLDIATLTRLAGELKGISSALTQLIERREQFAGQYRQYAEWVKLVDDGTRVAEDLQQLGELVQEYNVAFQTLSRQIRGHLSASKVDALPDAPTYTMQLVEIAEGIRRSRTKVTDQFTSLQESYRQALGSQLDFPSDRLWQPYQYNPIAPQEIYTRLYDEVQRTLQKGVCDQIVQVINTELGSIRDTLGSSLVKELPPDVQLELRQKGEQLEAVLGQLLAKLEPIREEAGHRNVIADMGQFGQLLERLASITNNVREHKRRVQGLSQTLRNMDLSGGEKLVLAAIRSNVDKLDLSELRQSSKGVSEDEFWKALRGLQAKRRVRVVIEPVRYD